MQALKIPKLSSRRRNCAEKRSISTREDACLPEGRYFVEDIIGCTAYDADSGEEYGTVTDVSVTGANDVWHITKNNKEYLIPAIDEVIVSAEPENERVIIRPMKGIFDDED